MKKEEKEKNQSYESDGVMGKEQNDNQVREFEGEDFFNTTPESE